MSEHWTTPDDRLFDIEAFTTGTPRRQRAKTVRPAVETVAVVVDRIWRIVNGNQPGIVHAALQGPTDLGYFTTWCGAGGGARTFQPGEVVPGCADCAAQLDERRSA